MKKLNKLKKLSVRGLQKKVRKVTPSEVSNIISMETIVLKKELTILRVQVKACKKAFEEVAVGADFVRKAYSRMAETNPNRHPIKANVFSHWKNEIRIGLDLLNQVKFPEESESNGNNASRDVGISNS